MAKLRVSEKDWKVGERVSLEKWDATEPPYNRIGPARITKIEHIETGGRWCESGTLITVRNCRGREQELDSSWLTKDS